MSILNSTPLLMGEDGYQISRSVRLRASASAYLNRTFTSSGNQQKWTLSSWFKFGDVTLGGILLTQYTNGENQSQIRFGASNYTVRFYDLVASSFVCDINWAPLYRDPSAWYHVVFAVDTTQATNTNRIKFYVNGVQVTATTSAAWPAQNSNLRFNGNTPHFINQNGAGSGIGDNYRTEINFVNAQQLDPTSFGEFNAITGVWQPKKYAGTYGTNGFYLNFSDNSAATAAAIGKDYSGNGNNWTPNNISVTAGVTYDSMIDTPTPYADGGNGRGNYAVVNPLQQGSYVTLSNGNLTVTGNTATNSALALASVGGLTSGKWYWEYTQGTVNSETCGIVTTYTAGTSLLNGENIGGFGIGARSSGAVYGGTVGSITSWASGDVIGLAVDCDNGAIYWSKNGTWLNSGVPTSGSSKTGAVGIWTPSSAINVQPAFGAYNGGFVSVTFGQRPFTYTPPTGFKALNTQNLPDSTIIKGNKHFDVVPYTGNSGTIDVTTNFDPDLVWYKNRSRASTFHYFFDRVRGANKAVYSNLTAAEDTQFPTYNTQSFITNGSRIVRTNGDHLNFLNDTYVSWLWKAGGAAVTNTAGSISSQVSANVSAGFSIVTYTGTGANATVGHGLGVAPKMVIVKNRNFASGNWISWHGSIAATQVIWLNVTNAAQTNAGFNNTIPTNSVFSVGTVSESNGSGNGLVAYCFAEVAGYSKFGSYTGNGSADGPFVYLGFRPRWVLIKNAGAADQWYLVDTSRDLSNPSGLHLYPNLSNAEFSPASSFPIDILSNGFKVRTASAGWNTSGQTYIYACFAENPFKNALAR